MTDALVAQRDGREGEPCVISHPNSATDRGNPIFAALRTPIESGEAKTVQFQQTLMKKTLFQAGLPFLFPTHTAPIIAGAPQILLPPHFFPVSPSDHGRRGPNWDRPEPAPAACSEPLGGFFLPNSAKIEQSLSARRLPQSQPLGAFLHSADPAVLQLIV